MGDITYLGLATGQWAYLACWRNAFSRCVVGWHVSESLHTELILTAFNRAVAICQPPVGLLVHADRGSQYTSDALTALLDRTQAIAGPATPTTTPWRRVAGAPSKRSYYRLGPASLT